MSSCWDAEDRLAIHSTSYGCWDPKDRLAIPPHVALLQGREVAIGEPCRRLRSTLSTLQPCDGLCHPAIRPEATRVAQHTAAVARTGHGQSHAPEIVPDDT